MNCNEADYGIGRLTVQEATKILACDHTGAGGGNDYISCPKCGLEWDYRKHTQETVLMMVRRHLRNLYDSVPGPTPDAKPTTPQVGAVYVLDGQTWKVLESYPSIGLCWIVECRANGEPVKPANAKEASYELIGTATKCFLPLKAAP